MQVSKTGALIDSMTLAAGAFDDTEGITYIGGGQFVLAEERERQLNRFTYAPGTTLTRAQVQSVKLGTTIGNAGIEGVAYDPFSGGFMVVKESARRASSRPRSTGPRAPRPTARRRRRTRPTSSTPRWPGLTDLADVFAQADGQLLVLSQESGRIVNATARAPSRARSTIGTAGRGPRGHDDGRRRPHLRRQRDTAAATGHPQLWVYAPSGPAARTRRRPRSR